MAYYNNYGGLYPAQNTQPNNYSQPMPYQYNSALNSVPNTMVYPQMPVKGQNIIWVQGRAGAEAYQLEPGSRAVLLDSQSQNFYIKEVSWDGRPLPLMTFKYEAVDFGNQNGPASSPAPETDMSKYVTKEDFNKLKEMIEDLTKPSEVKHGNSTVR